MGKPDQNKRMRAPKRLDRPRTRVIGAEGWNRITPLYAFLSGGPGVILRMMRPGSLPGCFNQQDLRRMNKC
jgi:hypothetical protein